MQEGYVHIKGELKSRFDESKPSIPVEILKCFDPKRLIPKRKLYTWEGSLKTNPRNVYDLSIGKGVFNTFPQEILSFKNIERIWVGGQAQFNFQTLPDDFFDLTELHTILIYGSKINHISEKISQLQKLEELVITSSQIGSLPSTIYSLPKLETINLKYNQLTSISKNICATPELKNLVLTGNKFKSLPKCLAHIESVEVGRKYRKLFIDLSYKSKNPNEIDESLYNLANYPEQKNQLEKSILEIPELQEFKDLIVDYSTMATYLALDKERKKIPLGASKVGGSPDLPSTLEHPKNKNGLLYVFHAQINCEEITSYQNYLPRKGILYFFVNDEEYAERPIVLYSEDIQNLKRYEYTENTKFTDSDLDGDYREAVAITFQNAISLPEFYNAHNHGTERFPKYASLWENTEYEDKLDFLSDYTEELKKNIDKPAGFDNGHIQLDTHSVNSSVFTQHESPQEIAASRFGGEPSEWMVLLNMESIDEFSFWDAGTLTYCIHKKDLVIKNFSTISTSIESS